MLSHQINQRIAITARRNNMSREDFEAMLSSNGVLVTALANETFANKCFSIMAPLANDSQCGPFTTETYHVAHAAWETKAPIRTMMPYVENGKNYLVGAFTCTPIASISARCRPKRSLLSPPPT